MLAEGVVIVRLAKDSDRLLVLMYKSFLTARKAGVSRGEAKHIGSSHRIQGSLLPKEAREDIDELCRELDRAGCLVCQYADDTIWDSYLSDAGIIMLENRFKDGLVGVLSFLAQFIP